MEEQIISFLREAEGGVPVKELCRKYGFNDASFYTWRAKFGGMDVSYIAEPDISFFTPPLKPGDLSATIDCRSGWRFHRSSVRWRPPTDC